MLPYCPECDTICEQYENDPHAYYCPFCLRSWTEDELDWRPAPDEDQY